jgi:hypothetical protein
MGDKKGLMAFEEEEKTERFSEGRRKERPEKSPHPCLASARVVQP